MAFIKFPIYFCDDDFEKKEDLGLKIEHTQGKISINTQQICAYNEMDNKNILIRMSNGDAYECPLTIDSFEDLLLEVDSIYQLSELSPN